MKLHLNPILHLVALTKVIAAPLDKAWERFKPYREGLLVQAVNCLALEAIGSIGGSYVGKAALGTISKHLVREITLNTVKTGIAPLVTSVLYFKSTNKTMRIAALVLAISSTGAGIYSYAVASDHLLESSAVIGLRAGEAGGEFIGMLLGGLAGIWLAGGMHHRDEAEAYSRGIGRYFLMGKSLEGVVFNYSIAPFNLVGKVTISILQSMAYNGPIVMSLVRRTIKGGLPPGALLPLAVRVSTALAFKNLATQESTVSLAHRFEALVPQGIFPEFLKRMVAHLEPSIPTWVNFGASSVSQQAEVLVQKMMHSFPEYIKELGLSEPVQEASQTWLRSFLNSQAVEITAVEDAIMAHIFRESELAHQAGKYLETHQKFNEVSQTLAEELMQSIRRGERAVIGKELLEEKQVIPLANFIAVHLRSFLLFTLYNYKEFPAILTKMEELIFLKQLQERCIGPYLALSLPSVCATGLSGGLGVTINAFHLLTKVIQDLKNPEQLTEREGRVQIVDESHFQKVEEKKERPDFDYEVPDLDNNEL